MVNPGCFKAERTRASSEGKSTETKKKRVVIKVQFAEDLYKSFREG
jgi:hypothetical protein